MRLISGTLRPTPLPWLPVLANIEPPALRRKAAQTDWWQKPVLMRVSHYTTMSPTHHNYACHPESICGMSWNQLTPTVSRENPGRWPRWSLPTSWTTPQSDSRVLLSLDNSGLSWTASAPDKATAVPVRRNWNSQTPTSVPAVRPKRCHTLLNPAHWQDYTVACPNYTLQTMVPLLGWPVMALKCIRDNNNNLISSVPSVRWRCWLGGRNGIGPVKAEWWGLAWLSVWSEVKWSETFWCHCHHIISCSSKIQNCLPFWCWLTQVVLDKKGW